MIRTLHPLPCGCERCRQREADRIGTAMFAGLATGAVIVGLCEAVRAILPAIGSLLS